MANGTGRDAVAATIDEEAIRAALALHGERYAEAVRLHGLADRWLGEAILRLARARPAAGAPELAMLAAEVARRLGCHAPAGPASTLDPTSLREAVSTALGREGAGGPLPPADPLLADPARGNPLAIALDRVAPPDADRPDAVASRVAGACAYLGIPRTTAWHPGMLPAPPAAVARPCHPGTGEGRPGP